MPGEFKKNYVLCEVLGRGAFAVVHKCREKKSGKEWAVKIIAKSGTDPVALRKEIEVLRKLDHPNIVKLKEVFEEKTSILLVMEFVTGGEMFDRIAQRGYYSEADASMAVFQMLTAIEHLHKGNIVHRDLKPENVLYENTSDMADLKIADFGLATVMSKGVGLSTMCGTPGYVAPEVLLGKLYGKPVDVYAIGVIMYILLSGMEPFYEENEALMYRRIIRGQWNLKAPIWKHISEAAKDLLKQLMNVKPEKRPSAAEALKHSWVKGNSAPGSALPDTLANIRSYNARRRLKAGIRAVVALNRMRRIQPTLLDHPPTLSPASVPAPAPASAPAQASASVTLVTTTTTTTTKVSAALFPSGATGSVAPATQRNKKGPTPIKYTL